MYEYKEVVTQVENLNSVSTLKKWRKKAEELAGVVFTRQRVRLGRHSSKYIFIFSEEDVRKFQIVANKKSELGLDKAIIFAFAPNKEPTMSVSEKISTIIKYICRMESEYDEMIKTTKNEIKSLKSDVKILRERIETLEEKPNGIKRLFQK
ncbi:hypothetical protein [Enterococcus hirae]|uniref:hypothetical protein n=1 Tax=Enterococcus hirae TaxID=1354 RepID=UPI001A9766D6|nr:hypothetical protein [Enterococcus hirae]MBO1102634.1 hypothetical protein [Enterococcus hirae]